MTRAEELRLIIRDARTELRGLTKLRKRGDNLTRAANREAALETLRAGGTLADVSASHGLAASYLRQLASSAGVSLRQARAARQTEIAAAYRTGVTMEQVGVQFKISRERVRQILVRYERITGERVPRHDDDLLPRVVWHCQTCGIARTGTANRVTPWGAVCGSCRRIDVPRAERLLALRRELGNWNRVAAHENLTATILTQTAYVYLRRYRKSDQIAELWPRGVPPYLARQPVDLVKAEAHRG